MGIAWVQEALIEVCFVAQEQQALRVGVEASDWIEIFREIELQQWAVGGTIGRELRKHTEWFVERDQHKGYVAEPGCRLKTRTDQAAIGSLA